LKLRNEIKRRVERISLGFDIFDGRGILVWVKFVNDAEFGIQPGRRESGISFQPDTLRRKLANALEGLAAAK
jgi:hypothetical protein